ncbi:MAG: DUF4238 domain-containing protein [Methylobacter sp.]|uniref:DUF4238 domain-containing protein n=1 Tax=Methylobacter sp. TaxID=2051955 RepID=UPI0027315119|nr:DUF4238 domain-containing protein [Methylobacter sp.]MDP1664980.1 DUF4238 domain-containing protein [Methylobacter sp.]
MSELTKTSERHHFVPQFYLKKWYEPGKNGFWLYFRDERGNIRLRQQRPAKAIGYEDNLYSFLPDGLTFHDSDSNKLEHGFFAQVDNAASVIHRKLLNQGVGALSADDRIKWAIFVNSLIERCPNRLRDIKSRAPDILFKLISELKQPSPSSTLQPQVQSIVDRMDSAAVVHNTVLSMLAPYIVDEPFIQYVTEMEWQTIDIPKGQDHFLTGDTPVVINAGDSSTPIHILSIAISPSRLLIMHKRSPEFDIQLCKIIAICHSSILVKQTKKHLVSSKKLTNSKHIKYNRIVEKMLRGGNSE